MLIRKIVHRKRVSAVTRVITMTVTMLVVIMLIMRVLLLLLLMMMMMMMMMIVMMTIMMMIMITILLMLLLLLMVVMEMEGTGEGEKEEVGERWANEDSEGMEIGLMYRSSGGKMGGIGRRRRVRISLWLSFRLRLDEVEVGLEATFAQEIAAREIIIISKEMSQLQGQFMEGRWIQLTVRWLSLMLCWKI
jgi:Ca2+/Na+ antiporter